MLWIGPRVQLNIDSCFRFLAPKTTMKTKTWMNQKVIWDGEWSLSITHSISFRLHLFMKSSMISGSLKSCEAWRCISFALSHGIESPIIKKTSGLSFQCSSSLLDSWSLACIYLPNLKGIHDIIHRYLPRPTTKNQGNQRVLDLWIGLWFTHIRSLFHWHPSSIPCELWERESVHRNRDATEITVQL